MRGGGRKEGGGQFQAGIFTKRDAKNAISKVAAAVGMLDLCTKKAGSPKWYTIVSHVIFLYMVVLKRHNKISDYILFELSFIFIHSFN